jgi:8-oxo-dGTP pyrophosphatase MutT (NUDIX family)
LSAYTWPPESSASPSIKPGRAEPVPAAVLVPIYRSGRATYLVLTRRRSDLRRHAGEISFPGGRRDPADRSLETTALREAEEEIGLAPDRVELIGGLPPTSTFATGYQIHPFVGTIPAGVAWRLSPREVDSVLELPLAEIRSGRTVTRLQRRGINFLTDAYVVGDDLIWGATARIIENLLGRLDDTGEQPRLLGGEDHSPTTRPGQSSPAGEATA